MPTDPDDEFEPPPSDRSWRHPSEIGAEQRGRPARFVSRQVQPTPPRVWLAAAMGALVGAAATLSVILLSGGFRTVEREPTGVERQHVMDLEANPDAPIAIAEKVLPAVAEVDVRGLGTEALGTAVVFNSNGYLITTADLVDGADQITVRFADGEALPAELVGSDLESDVAVLKVARTQLPVVVLGRPADQLQLGEPVLAIDSTLGGAAAPKIPPQGLVNGLGKRVESEQPATTLFGLIQTNLQLTTAATGAPLVDANGAVIGIVTSRGYPVPGDEPQGSSAGTAGTTEGAEGTAGTGVATEQLQARYATPIDFARQVADALILDGTYERASLGLTEGANLTAEEAGAWEVAGGVRVTRLREDGPAASAGLADGDVVVRLEDEPITSWDSLVVALRRYQPGETVTVWYYRSGEVELQPALTRLDAR